MISGIYGNNNSFIVEHYINIASYQYLKIIKTQKYYEKNLQRTFCIDKHILLFQ